MREVCFCGRQGLITDRIPVYAGDGEWGLECPDCGHLDRLLAFRADDRHDLLSEASERQRERAAVHMRALHERSRFSS